jgi:tyrosine-protein phosphatase SIW14
MDARLRWALGVGLAVFLITAPVIYYRWSYAQEKRLREADPGMLYRSGQMTADGFRHAIRAYGIRTIINAQDEYPDPDIQLHFFTREAVKESALCRELGVRYIHLAPDLIPRRLMATERPRALDPYLAILDDPASYPVLIHCKAGLHRTGVLTAVYRMEYQGWTAAQAIADLKANGFDEWDCTAANDYINQYVLSYQPGIRRPGLGASLRVPRPGLRITD